MTGCAGIKTVEEKVEISPFISGCSLNISFSENHLENVELFYKELKDYLGKHPGEHIQMKVYKEGSKRQGGLKEEHKEEAERRLENKKKIDQNVKELLSKLVDFGCIIDEDDYYQKYPEDCTIPGDWYISWVDYSSVRIRLLVHEKTDLYKIIKDSGINGEYWH